MNARPITAGRPQPNGAHERTDEGHELALRDEAGSGSLELGLSDSHEIHRGTHPQRGWST